MLIYSQHGQQTGEFWIKFCVVVLGSRSKCILSGTMGKDEVRLATKDVSQ